MNTLFTELGVDGFATTTITTTKQIEYIGLGNEWRFEETKTIKTSGTLIKDGKSIIFQIDESTPEAILAQAKKSLQMFDFLDRDTDVSMPENAPEGKFDDRKFQIKDISSETLQKIILESQSLINDDQIVIENYTIEISETQKKSWNSLGGYTEIISSNYSSGFELICTEKGNGQYSAGGRETSYFMEDESDIFLEAFHHIQAKRKQIPCNLKGGKMQVRFSRDVAEELIEGLCDSLDGGAIFEQRSPYNMSYFGKKIAGIATLESLPTLDGSPYNFHFDSEGYTCLPLTLIKNGTLENCFVNSKYGKKLNIQPQGQSQPCNLVLSGEYNEEKEKNTSLEITFLKGFHTIDQISGNFALEAEGYILEEGVRKQCINRFGISGNLRDLFQNIVSIGKDARKYHGSHIPSFLVENIEVTV